MPVPNTPPTPSPATPALPTYTAAERAVDAAVHGVGVPLGLIGAVLLVFRAATAGGPALLLPVGVYGLALVGMLAASAAYQTAHPSPRKERLRQIDRMMIFAMIAGTYTPISATVLRGHGGLILCALVWALAGTGAAITLAFRRRFERVLMALYLALGWMMLLLVKTCAALLLPTVFWLIVAGGGVYTLGAIVHALRRLRFHNPIWHALILCAAGLQYAAIGLQLTGHAF